MKQTCPKCGHNWEAPAKQQAIAGKSRWQGVSAKKRSEAASKAAKARWAVNHTVDSPSGKLTHKSKRK